MDVLKPASAKWRLPHVLVLAWLLATACLSMPSSRRTEPSFPHRVHVIDNQLACTVCHGSVLSSEQPGMPPPELCAPCHDQFDGDKPMGRRVSAFFDEQSRYRTVAVSGLTSDVTFSHRQHVTGAKLDCVACHGDVASQEDVPLAPLARMAACVDCHQQAGLSNACEQCHVEINAGWPPPSHLRNWMRGHGEVSRRDSEISADNCALCHENATGCVACHQQMPPADHDQTFRLRTHGLRASIDRGRCAVCHTQDGCQQCHQVTRPRSHRGGFGAPGQRHCVGCHLPVVDNGCAVCHPSAPSHELATALPADHLPSMNCRQCHGNGVSLPHPDGGHVCTACHR